MKVGIIGAGPAGLYFGLLMKKHNPKNDIRIVEKNPADNTYGWGVVLSGRTLSFMEETDCDSYVDIANTLKVWDDIAIVHRGQKIKVGGNKFSAIARIDLLRILQKHCQRHGVKMQFETEVAGLEPFPDCDLIVGADGIHSVIRHMTRQHFQPSLDERPNKYIWYGTNQLFDALTLTFGQNKDGVFIGHCYRYNNTTSTFIVECDAATWQKVGFASMSDKESRAYCEEVFKDDLSGHPLLSNSAVWLNFVVVNNRHWYHNNVVLIGDSLHTVHFSIGSGTRMALQDAIALYRAFGAHGEDIRSALKAFEKTRRPIVDAFLQAARRSFVWYENIRDRMHLDPIPFAYDYMLRTGNVDHDRLRKRAPEFVAAYESLRTSQGEGEHRA